MKKIFRFVKKHWTLIAAILYLVWPLDIFPDFLLPFGALDDTGLMVLAIIREIVMYINNNSSKAKERKIIEGEVVRNK